MADLPDVSWLAALTRFEPESTIAPPPDWDEAVQFLAHHGLAPLAAYNLQYRMPRADVPETIRDVLLGYMQGVTQDNVFKFVTLKNLMSELADVRLVLLDAAGSADQLYPHVGFRPVPELRLLIREADVGTIVQALQPEKFLEVEGDEPDPDEPRATLYNERFYIKLYTRLLPKAAEDEGLFERAVPSPVYGAGVSRLSAEDALLTQALSMARRAFGVPLIQYIDLREMAKGDAPAAFRGGAGAPVDPASVKEKAARFGMERALWAAMELLAFYHPDVAERARELQPSIGMPSRTLLQTAVIGPAKDPARSRQLRGADKLVQLLLG